MENRYMLTDVQLAYLVGRDKKMFLGGNSTHAYLEFEGNTVPSEAEEALNKVISCHKALRLVVYSDGTQEVLENPPHYEIVCDDLSGMDKAEQDEIIEKYRRDNSHKIHETGKYPMFSFHAFRLGENTYRYAFESDLMIMDRSSFEIMFSDIAACIKDKSYVPKPLPSTFIDYVYARNELRDKRHDIDKKYWENYFEENGIPEPCSIPLYSNMGDASGNRFTCSEITIPEEQWSAVKEKLLDMRIVPSVFLLVCYAKTLSKWQNNPHTAVNMTTALRNIGGEVYSRNIGDFTELLIADVDFRKHKDLFKAAKAVQKTIAEHLDHPGFGGINVMKYISEKLDREGTALYPYAFTSSIDGAKSNIGENIFGKNVYQITQTPQVITDCQVAENNGSLNIRIDHPENTAVSSAVDGMAEYMKGCILSEEHPEIFAEQREYNQTAGTVSGNTIQQSFKETCMKFPEKTAVICAGEKITFSQLDRLSDMYAEYIEKNAGCGKRIAVEADRKIETVAAILGVLKTGGSYIPLEPKWPDERKCYVMEKSGCGLYINDPASQKLECSGYEIKGSADDEAYIIFTSGSTGKPKGVVINQKSACNTVYDINSRFSINENDVFAGISSFCFDLSVYDLFGCFSTGGTLLLCRDIVDAVDEVVKYNATVWNTVPAIMGLFISELEKSCSLRTVMLSGDWIPLDLKERISAKIPDAEVISLGGATEGSIWSIYYPINEVRKEWKSIPYGYPLLNQNMWILDFNDEICPTGVAGEICIGGVGVAAGYAGDKQKTDAQFFVHDTLGRLYRTGDYGVFTEEGYIEFLGRRDFQVKLRGYRIELGEIEAAINKNESVLESAVNVYHAPDGTDHLEAYAVPAPVNVDEECLKAASVVLERADSAAGKEPDGFSPEKYSEVTALYEDAATELIKNTFAGFGLMSEAENEISAEKVISLGYASEKYRKLIEQWISVMIRKGYMKADAAGTIKTTAAYSSIDPEKITESVSKLEAADDVRNYRRFFLGTAAKIPELLCEKSNALEIMFPDGKFTFMEEMYQNSVTAKYLNNIIAEAVEQYVKCRVAAGEKVRILEVGAGVGGTTYDVVNRIAGIENADVEYCFTDLSDFFFEGCKTKFAGYDFIKYGYYNIDEHPEMQGYEAGTFDIIIGANCLHDSADIRTTLGYLRLLLKKGGMLAVLELTENLVQYKTTIGFVGGFLGYNDDRLKANEILISADEWAERAMESGFESVSAYPHADSPMDIIEQNVIIMFNAANAGTLRKKSIIANISGILTEYMIPEGIYSLNKIPLTANGKVNKAQLPVPHFKSTASAESSDSTPVTELQKTITEAVEKVLNTKNVGIDTNIFRIGIDSLKAITLSLELEKKGINVSLPELYKYPDIASLEGFILKNGRQGESASESIVFEKRKNRNEPFVLTDQQQSYAFERVGADSNDAAIITGGYGEYECPVIDIKRLENALNTIIEKNDIFRCVFNEDGTGKVLDSIPYYHIKNTDISSYGEKEKQEWLDSRREEIKNYHPDMSKPPLMYIEVTTISEDKSIIHLFTDGLLLDGWSHELFTAELNHIYNTGECLFENNIEYSVADYSEYMHSLKGLQKYKNDEKYWKDKIKTLPQPASLPVLCDISELSEASGVQNRCGISDDIWNKLTEYSSDFGVSMFSILLTSFSYVIGRWNRKRSFLLNVPEFNRPQSAPQLETAMGVYSSFLIFTSDIEYDKSFLYNVKKVQQEILELKEHNSFNGMSIMREMNRLRNEYSNSIYVPIVFGMMPDIPTELENVISSESSGMKMVYQENHTSNIWIDINIIKINNGREFNWCSVNGLFDDEMIGSMINLQQEILSSAAYDNGFWDKPLYIPVSEKDKLVIAQSNDTYRSYEPTDLVLLLHESFKKNADRLCIGDENTEYSYSQTESVIRKITSQLLENGISEGDKIAVCVENGMEQLMYVIAAVYMGVVYVPLDYSSSKENIIKYMNASGCKAVVVSGERAEELADCCKAIVCGSYNDSDVSVIDLPERVSDSSLAYITLSGNHAVAVSHKSAVNCILSTSEMLGIDENDTSAVLSGIACDSSFFEIFAMLSAGGKITVSHENSSPESLCRIISQRKATLICGDTKMLNTLCSLGSEKLSCVKNVILFNDEASVETAGKIAERFDNAEVFVAGGSAETTFMSIMNRIYPDGNGAGIYGKPSANCQYHILNENLDEVPVGLAGLMYCSGACLADGYIDDPEATSKNFIVHPKSGIRMFATNCLGKYDKDGNIIFEGHEEGQARVNGERVNLYSVKKALLGIDGVESAEVIVNRDEITAFYTSNDETDSDKVMAALKEQLADGSIPENVIKIDTIPYDANGTADTAKLIEIYKEYKSDMNRKTQTESSAVTEKLVSFFSEMFGRSMSASDDFFESGGDSIMAIKMLNKVRKNFVMDYTIQDFYNDSSAAKIAATLSSKYGIK